MSLHNLTESLRNFQETIEQKIVEVFTENQDDIVYYVSEIQLYMEGMRGSDGAFIMDYMPYSRLTIKLKEIYGQPTDRVTLRDTGDFHKSFRIEPTDETIEITADDWKTEELKDRYGEGIMALSDEHLQSVKQAFVLPGLRSKLWEALT